MHIRSLGWSLGSNWRAWMEYNFLVVTLRSTQVEYIFSAMVYIPVALLFTNSSDYLWELEPDVRRVDTLTIESRFGLSCTLTRIYSMLHF